MTWAFLQHPAVKPATKAAGAATVVTVAAWLAIAGPFVGSFEGYTPHPYIDRVGTGHPVTWCYGKTGADGKIPPLSAVFTKEECTKELEDDLNNKYWPAIAKCIHVALPPHRQAALVSFAYNLGPGAVCYGPVGRYLNAGNVVAACNSILAYDHANGVRLAGLTRRRIAERALCLRND